MKMQVPPDFSELKRSYAQLLAWCGILEAIADFLPCHVDEAICNQMATDMIPLLDRTYQMEERLLSGSLGLIMSDCEQIDAELRRKTSRRMDRDAAQRVTNALEALKSGRCCLSSDAIGYLFRSFLHSMRGHIKSEQEIMTLFATLSEQRLLAAGRYRIILRARLSA
ncbi:hypothetical protein AJ87_10980 [Rhizobium yanglingense]|nr:hypothetical protein AJ87_10980 [Rhizobium yanglingense]